MGRSRPLLVAAIALSSALMSCTASTSEEGRSAGNGPPIALILSDSVVRAGDVITVEVRSNFAVVEGVDTTLQGWVGGRLKPMYTLIKDSSSFWRVDDGRQHVLPLVGLQGGVPRTIKIPEGLPPENYRIEDEVSVMDEFPGHAEKPQITLTARLRVVP